VKLNIGPDWKIASGQNIEKEEKECGIVISTQTTSLDIFGEN
jgi:hypothetical protein